MRSRKPRASPFTKILNRLLDERHLGIREAARIAGVGPSTIMSWKSGALPEDYQAVKRLAEGMGTTLSFLLTGENDAASAGPPTVAEIFDDGGVMFDGYARISIRKLIPRNEGNK